MHSLPTCRSFGGHSTWLVALTIATSNSFKQIRTIKPKGRSWRRRKSPWEKSREECRCDSFEINVNLYNQITKNLEIAIEISEANFGGVLESSVGFSKAFHITIISFTINSSSSITRNLSTDPYMRERWDLTNSSSLSINSPSVFHQNKVNSRFSPSSNLP